MKKILISLLALMIFASACNEDILEVKNQNQYSYDTYFTGSAQFNEAVIATYAILLGKGMYARDWYFLFDLMGNDAERDAPLLGDLLQLHDFTFGSSHIQISELWQSLYRMVLRANLVIEQAEKWEPTAEADRNLKQQYIAEAQFFRGYAHLYLASLWGRVPLKPDFASSGELFTARSRTAQEVWDAAETGFKLAIDGLPVVYPGVNDEGRATRGAAIAFLAKTYLYQGKYAEAETELRKLLTSPYDYDLAADYDDLFRERITTQESVFEVKHNWTGWGSGNAFYMFGGQEAWGGRTTHTGRNMEYGWNDWRNVVISSAAVNSFSYNDEQGNPYIDPRAALTFYGDAASGGDTDYCDFCDGGPVTYPISEGYRWRKYNRYEYRANEGQPESEIHSKVIRFADVKLMLAETLIEQNKDLGQALQHINDIRNRVGAFAYTSLGNQENARTILRRERRLELSGEQVRYFDLIRWGNAQQTLNAEKQIQIGRQPFQPRNVLLPIPQAEKEVNAAMDGDIANDWN
jgi:starch-binding outer membrane protein, SusD/RagB family